MNIEATQMRKQTSNGTYGNLNKTHAKHSFKNSPENQTVRFIRLEAGCTLYGIYLRNQNATDASEFTVGVETTHPSERGGTYLFGKATTASNGVGASGTLAGIAESYKYPVYITVTNLTANANADSLLTVEYVYDGVS